MIPRRKWVGFFVACGVVLVLGVWHFQDVGAGVAVSGYTWLYAVYAALLGFGALFLVLAAYGFGKEVLLERLYFPVVMGLGLFYLFVLAPLSAPDEVSHYISSYRVSDYLLGQEAEAGNDRIYIRSCDTYLEDFFDVMADDGSGFLTGKEGEKALVVGQELTRETYRVFMEQGLGREAGVEPAAAVSYQLPVRTTPLAYLPQALGVTLARLLSLNGAGLVYLGRFFNLLFFALMGRFTLHRLPFSKAVFFGVSLLPMTLHLAASFSYDVMLIACGGLFTAVCLDLAFRAERVRFRDVFLMMALIGVMGPCKMVYGALAGYGLLIPVKKFGGWKRFLLSAALVLATFAGAMFAVNRATVAMYASGGSGYIAWAGESGYTFSYLLHNPLLVMRLCYNTLAWNSESLFGGMIGSALSNLDPVLNTPFVAVLLYALLLLVLALKKPGEPVYFSAAGRVWVFLLSALVLGALMFSMLLAWTPVSASTVQGVQGRYLLPLLPMFLIALRNGKVVRTGDWDHQILFFMAALSLYVVLRIFATVCLR